MSSSSGRRKNAVSLRNSFSGISRRRADQTFQRKRLKPPLICYANLSPLTRGAWIGPPFQGGIKGGFSLSQALEKTVSLTYLTEKFFKGRVTVYIRSPYSSLKEQRARFLRMTEIFPVSLRNSYSGISRRRLVRLCVADMESS